MRQHSGQQEITCPVASRRQNFNKPGQSTVISQTTEIHDICGRKSRPLQTIKPLPQVRDGDPSLPEQLNNFYAWFEALNNTPALKAKPHPEEQILCLTPTSVRRVLRDCVEQMKAVLTSLTPHYNRLLFQNASKLPPSHQSQRCPLSRALMTNTP